MASQISPKDLFQVRILTALPLTDYKGGLQPRRWSKESRKNKFSVKRHYVCQIGVIIFDTMRRGVPEIPFEGGVIRDYRGFSKESRDTGWDVLFADVKGEGISGDEKLNVCYDPTPSSWSKEDDEWGKWAALRAELVTKLGGHTIGNHRLVRIGHAAACREGIIAGLTIITKGSDGNAIVRETPEPRQK